MMGEMKKCVCGGKFIETTIERSGIKLNGMRCSKCGEVYFPSSEMMRYEILTGKSSLVRKVRKSGDSIIVTVPKQIVEKFNVHEDDMVYFESGESNKELTIKILNSNKK